MSEREQFEARAAEKLRLPVEFIQSAWNGDSYLHAFDSMNVMQPLNGWWDWWQASREALNAEQGEDGWIACADRMPEEGGRYWCYVEEQNSLGKSHYQWNCSWNGDEWSGEALSGRVTHWMPLPSPPAANHPIDTTPNQYDALGKGGEQ